MPARITAFFACGIPLFSAYRVDPGRSAKKPMLALTKSAPNRIRPSNQSSSVGADCCRIDARSPRSNALGCRLTNGRIDLTDIFAEAFGFP